MCGKGDFSFPNSVGKRFFEFFHFLPEANLVPKIQR